MKASAESGNYQYAYKFKSGSVANLTYYIDNTANQALFSNAINSAVAQWVTATAQNTSKAKVGFTRVYSAAEATVVFKAAGTFPSWASNALGYTELYSGSTLVTVNGGYPSSDWDKCVVYLKTTLSPSSSQAQRTACHEVGHCLGLAHPSITTGYSIMYPSGSSSYATDYPTATDANQIEMKY